MKQHRLATLALVIALTSAAPSREATPQRVQVDSRTMGDQILKKAAPVYPPLARQARIQGTVVLKERINTSGDVVNLELISGHPKLAPSAIEAVKQWKYRPYVLNGEPVEVETQVVVNFTLADNPATLGVAGDAPGGTLPPGDQGTPAVPQRVRVSQGVSQGLNIKKVPPEYPQDARDQRIQGVVVMKVTIDKEGKVASIQLISGHPMLAPPAMEAVKQWKYRPYQLNGTPVEVETQVTVNFTLAG